LTSLFPDTDFDTLLRHAELSWVQGHGRCRGNALADEHARVAACGKNGEASSMPLQATPKALLDNA
jgi:ribonuclease HI